ncbi:prepilin-type N-terminal cleavage/methylation domain-containing protein [Candidatus Gottesmanbacteria bacterium]|nr:prepilin-type N-terminal cleavage/methylation domain-containing protein [Candidatus Gottesmanbacteria bacterium]
MKKGFTLNELLIVIVIIILLLLVAFPNLKRQIDKAYDARRKSDLAMIRRAFEEYYNDHQCYPPLTILSPCGGSQLQPYIKEVPCDPVKKWPYKYIAQDETNLCKGYRLFAALSNTADPDIPAVGCNAIAGCGYGTEWNWGFAAGGTLTAPGFDPNLVPTPTPLPAQGNYACDPNGICNVYADPRHSGCPVSYNREDCNNACGNPANRCLQ